MAEHSVKQIKMPLNWSAALVEFRSPLLLISEPDLKTTLREFSGILQPKLRIAPCDRCAHWRSTGDDFGLAFWQRYQPKAPSLAKLRRFLDNAGKWQPQGEGIKPVERVPYKIIKPIQRVRYARLCPFCRKARGEIRNLGANSFQGVCPKCAATGPKRESHQEALRAWNGRE